MTEGNADKQLTPEYYGECADQVEGQLPIISKQVLGNRMNLLKSQMDGSFVMARYYERLVEREEALYYQLRGIEACLRLVANNEDPKPLIEKLLTEAMEFVKPKEHDMFREKRNEELELIINPEKYTNNFRKTIEKSGEQK